MEVAAVTQGPVKEMGEDVVPRLVPFVNETLLLKVRYPGVAV